MRLAGSGKTIFTTEEAISYWGSPHNAKIALHRLIRKGWLASLEKGKYMIIPLEAGPERKWTEDTYIVASSLAEPAAIAYWSAVRHWNWTEQIPRIVYVQTTQRKKTPRKEIFGVEYEFVRVKTEKFYGNVKEWRNGKFILITSREKTLIDCADDVERAGGPEELVKAVKSAASEISWPRLSEYVAQFPNKAVQKRLGYLFEKLVQNLPSEASGILGSWQKNLSAGVVPLQPSRSKTGKISRRWRVRINAALA